MKFTFKNFFIPPVLMSTGGIVMLVLYIFLPGYNVISYPLNLCGLLFIAPGFACMGKAWETFRKYKTTLYFERSSFLVTEGIFKYTRNPMYIGMFLVVSGAALFSMNIFSLAVPLVFISIIGAYFIPLEEKMMLDEFKEEYINYKNKVRRWI